MAGANPWAAAEVTVTYPGQSEALASVRGDVARWCEDQSLGAEVTDHAVLVVSELASNAVEAAPGHPFAVTLRRLSGTSATIRVANRADRSTPPPRSDWRPPDPLAPRGRGLSIVAAVCQQVDVEYPADGEVAIVASLGEPSSNGNRPQPAGDRA